MRFVAVCVSPVCNAIIRKHPIQHGRLYGTSQSFFLSLCLIAHITQMLRRSHKSTQLGIAILFQRINHVTVSERGSVAVTKVFLSWSWMEMWLCRVNHESRKIWYTVMCKFSLIIDYIRPALNRLFPTELCSFSTTMIAKMRKRSESDVTVLYQLKCKVISWPNNWTFVNCVM